MGHRFLYPAFRLWGGGERGWKKRPSVRDWVKLFMLSPSWLGNQRAAAAQPAPAAPLCPGMCLPIRLWARHVAVTWVRCYLVTAWDRHKERGGLCLRARAHRGWKCRQVLLFFSWITNCQQKPSSVVGVHQNLSSKLTLSIKCISFS